MRLLAALADGGAMALTRALLPRAVFAAATTPADGGSLSLRRVVSLVTLPASERTEGGRGATLGVPKMDDSRRELGTGAFVAVAGVFAVLPRACGNETRLFNLRSCSISVKPAVIIA